MYLRVSVLELQMHVLTVYLIHCITYDTLSPLLARLPLGPTRHGAPIHLNTPQIQYGYTARTVSYVYLFVLDVYLSDVSQMLGMGTNTHVFWCI